MQKEEIDLCEKKCNKNFKYCCLYLLVNDNPPMICHNMYC
jgi:hypothetical protein